MIRDLGVHSFELSINSEIAAILDVIDLLAMTTKSQPNLAQASWLRHWYAGRCARARAQHCLASVAERSARLLRDSIIVV